MDSEKVKKIILISVIVVAVLAVGTVVAILIANNRNKPTTDPTTVGTKPTTIRVWGLWEDDATFSSVVDAYKTKNPNITISYKNREDVRQNYKNTLKSRLEDGNSEQVPDIFIIHNTWTEEFSKYMTPIPTNIYSSSQIQSTFVPSVYESLSVGESTYSLPIGYDGLGLYYNKKLLSDKGITLPATDWDKFKTDAIKLTLKDSNGKIVVAGAALGAMSNVDFSFEILSTLMMQNGATMTDAAGSSTTFGTDTAAASALKYYADFSNTNATWDKSLPRDITMFAEGRLAMMFAPLWRADSIKKANPDLDFDIAAIPQLADISGTKRIDYADYWSYGVASVSQNKAQAFDFLKYLTSKEALNTLSSKASTVRLFGQFPPRADMLSDQNSVKYFGGFTKMAQTGQTWKMFDKETVSGIFKTDIDANISSAYSLSGAQTIMTSLATKVDQILSNKTGNVVVKDSSSSSSNSSLNQDPLDL